MSSKKKKNLKIRLNPSFHNLTLPSYSHKGHHTTVHINRITFIHSKTLFTINFIINKKECVRVLLRNIIWMYQIKNH